MKDWKKERRKLIEGFIEDVECLNLDSKKTFRAALNILADDIEKLAEQRLIPQIESRMGLLREKDKEVSRLKAELKAWEESPCGECERLKAELDSRNKQLEEVLKEVRKLAPHKIGEQYFILNTHIEKIIGDKLKEVGGGDVNE